MVEGQKICNLSCFQELVHSETADIAWVTETWLTNNIANAEILHNDYAIYRNDRKCRAGGGVMVAVKPSSFISSRELSDIKTDLEVISAELISSSKLKFVICCCYRPPNAKQSWTEKFNLYMTELSSRYDNILICGDFNFPKIHWESPTASFGTDEDHFTEQLNDFFLTQQNHERK
jgi:exonuclease III